MDAVSLALFLHLPLSAHHLRNAHLSYPWHWRSLYCISTGTSSSGSWVASPQVKPLSRPSHDLMELAVHTGGAWNRYRTLFFSLICVEVHANRKTAGLCSHLQGFTRQRRDIRSAANSSLSVRAMSIAIHMSFAYQPGLSLMDQSRIILDEYVLDYYDQSCHMILSFHPYLEFLHWPPASILPPGRVCAAPWP